MRRIGQFVALSALTAREATRQPICLLLTTTCVVLIALLPLVLLHKFGEDGKLVRESALAFHFVFGLAIAGLAASSSLGRELRGGTAAVVLSKPVGRESFFLAKFAGVCGMLLAFSLCAGLATLLSERIAEKLPADPDAAGYVTDGQTARLLLAAPALAFLAAAWLNYRRRAPFQSTAYAWVVALVSGAFLLAGFFDLDGRFAPYNLHVQWRISAASALVTLALLVFAAIAVALATRLRTAPTVALCAGIFLLGLVTDHLFGRPDAGFAPAVLRWMLPNWQHFWLADALDAGGAVAPAYLIHAAAYALLYGTGVLALGLAAFRRAEVR
jgi:hypothetical protein